MALCPLIRLAQQFIADEASFRARHPNPWLVWSVDGPRADPPAGPTVGEKEFADTPKIGAPLAIEIVKSPQSSFPMGLTLGRSDNNDVVLPHEQVSRFHAFFLPDKRGRGLTLSDAESHNGTWIDGDRLAPRQADLLPPRAVLRFGTLEVEYFSAEAFLEYLRTF